MSDITYTRITPNGEEKCCLLNGEGMTVEEMQEKLREYCELATDFYGCNSRCPLHKFNCFVTQEQKAEFLTDDDKAEIRQAYATITAPNFVKVEKNDEIKLIDGWEIHEENSKDIGRTVYAKPIFNFVKANPDDEVKQADDVINSGLADSGTRREFASGAVRDVAEGKGDMVSFPNAAILRLSKHYEAGAKKYGRWNYTKGIPVSSFMDSALRHIFKYLDGWDDEDHLAAAAFNVLGAMQMEAKHPELIDVPNREGKNRFEYKEDNR